VLVHVGFALARIDEAEAAATLAELASLGKDFDEELKAFAGSGVADGQTGTDPVWEGPR
jgi:hydrogenase expression/formation protein HypC